VVLDTTLRQTLSGAWMHRKDDRHFSGKGIDCSQRLTLDIRMALHLMPSEYRRGPPEAPMRCFRSQGIGHFSAADSPFARKKHYFNA